jgi:hypothetical protein
MDLGNPLCVIFFCVGLPAAAGLFAYWSSGAVSGALFGIVGGFFIGGIITAGVVSWIHEAYVDAFRRPAQEWARRYNMREVV